MVVIRIYIEQDFVKLKLLLFSGGLRIFIDVSLWSLADI